MVKELILGYISLVYSMFIHTLCFKKCTKSVDKQSKPKKLILLLIFTLLSMLNNIFMNNYFRIFMSIIILVFLLKFIFQNDLKETIIGALLLSSISIIIELLLTGIMTLFIKNMQIVNESYAFKTIITFIFCTIFYLIVSLPFINKTINKIIKNLKQKISIEILLCITVVIINIFTIVYGENYKDYQIFFIIIISLISVITLVLLISCLILSKSKLDIQNKILRENIEEYEKIADDYSELKHNLTNDLLAIKSIANKKAQDLVDEKIKKYHKNYNWVNKLSNIPKGLQGLVYIKLNSITKYKINFEVKSNLKDNLIEKIKSKTYANLCDILGIILDNAVEATRKSKDKSIFINMEESNQEVKIQIINTFKDELDLDKIGKSKYSTKGLKRGIGLNYINKISNKSIKVKKEIINNLFVVNISFDI